MATWHGYVLLAVDAGFAATLDAAKREKIRAGVKALITETTKDGRDYPPYILGEPRWRLDHREVILEGRWNVTSKSEFVKKIAAELGVTQAAVNNATTLTVFEAGKDALKGAAAARAYIEANSAEWNNSSV